MTATARDRLIRRSLWTSVPYNLGGALLFAFPDSLGRLAGFPVPVPRIYTAALAFLVTLFAGTYAWLALQPRIDRPLVAFAAIGKAGFFVVVAVCWLLGEVPGQGVIGTCGDLVLAGTFAWWLVADAGAVDASAGSRVDSPTARRRA